MILMSKVTIKKIGGTRAMKKALQIILAFMIACCSSFVLIEAAESESVKINSKNFPDKGFREYIKEEWDRNSNNVLDPQELEDAYFISIHDKAVKSIEGCEYLSNLQNVVISSSSSIKEIDVSNLPQTIKYLSLYMVGIKDLSDLYELNLEVMSVSYDLFYELDLDKLTVSTISIFNHYPIHPKTTFPLKYINDKWDITRLKITSGGKIKNGNLTGYDVVKRQHDITAVYKSKKGDITIDFELGSGLSRPSNFTVERKTYNTLELNWALTGLIQGVEIHRATDRGGVYRKIGYVKMNQLGEQYASFASKNLIIGQRYYYKVRSVYDINGYKVYGPFSCVVSGETYIAKPKLKVSASTATTKTLKWNAVDGAQKYQVYRDNGNGKWKHVHTLTTGTKKKVNYQSGYQFKVRACRKSGGEWKYSSFSNKV